MPDFKAECLRLIDLLEKEEQRLDWLWLDCEKRYSKVDGRWHISWVFPPAKDGEGWTDIRDAIDAKRRIDGE